MSLTNKDLLVKYFLINKLAIILGSPRPRETGQSATTKGLEVHNQRFLKTRSSLATGLGAAMSLLPIPYRKYWSVS